VRGEELDKYTTPTYLPSPPEWEREKGREREIEREGEC
jgi:hypothetical protein